MLSRNEVQDSLHSSLNLAFRQYKLHNILFSEWLIDYKSTDDNSGSMSNSLLNFINETFSKNSLNSFGKAEDSE